MGTIIEYLQEYREQTFAQRPLCEADVLVLTQLSYLHFDGLIPAIGERREPVSLYQIAERMDPDSVFERWYEKESRALWAQLLLSERFRGMRCSFYRSRTEPSPETQFAAMTFFPKGCMPVVVFRGTDESIVGWKEDFGLAFSQPLPSQEMSALYLNQVSTNFGGKFLVCGHSKGGNLAVYASVRADRGVQERIAAVYSMDGPGFLPGTLSGDGYERVKGKIQRIVPQYSLVGMLLHSEEEYRVVKSSARSFLQHDGHTWQIEKGELVTVEDISQSQKRFNETLNQWILALSEEERRVMVDTLFSLVDKTGVKTLTEFLDDWRGNLRICFGEMRKLDQETRAKIRKVIRLLWTMNKAAGTGKQEKK